MNWPHLIQACLPKTLGDRLLRLRAHLFWVSFPVIALARTVAGWMTRNPRSWVFGYREGYGFAGNPKYFFLDAIERGTIDATWITRDPVLARTLRGRGLPAYHFLSPRGVLAQLRAGVYVYDHYVYGIGNWFFTGAVLVNLWHGVGLKEIEHHLHATHDEGLGRFRRWLHGLMGGKAAPDLMVTTGANTVGYFARSFWIPAERVLVTGYPRNDVLGRSFPHTEFGSDPDALARLRRDRRDGIHTLLYAPTFRDANDNIDDFWNDTNLERLDRHLATHGQRLYLKVHPGDRFWRKDLSRWHWIVDCDRDADVYPLLAECDTLITDYSSLCYDYLLLDRRIIFLNYDQEAYNQASRCFVLPYEDYSPGPKIQDFASFIDELSSSKDDYRSERMRVRAYFFDKADFAAGPRATHAIVSAINRLRLP